MDTIEITRGSHRMGRFLSLGETLEVGNEIPERLADELVNAGRARRLAGPAGVKAIETQDAPPLAARPVHSGPSSRARSRKGQRKRRSPAKA